MGWTYRVVKQVLRRRKAAWAGHRDASPEQVFYSIREVYDTGLFAASGKPAGGESLDALKADLTAQTEALTRPILVLDGGRSFEDPAS